ncbi:hypothetical protein P7C70_g3443, partial [Phenoliferia sp. Uapishka_3]
MARQSRGRPAARPAAKAPAAQQTRPASTQAAPPAHAPAPGVPAQMGQKQPGMMAGIAQTAAGVAAGSVMGHGLSSMLFGGGSSSAAAEVPAAAPQAQSFEERRMGGACENSAKGTCGLHIQRSRKQETARADGWLMKLVSLRITDFTQCLSATGNDMSACDFYLQQLKACQSAAAQY